MQRFEQLKKVISPLWIIFWVHVIWVGWQVMYLLFHAMTFFMPYREDFSSSYSYIYVLNYSFYFLGIPIILIGVARMLRAFRGNSRNPLLIYIIIARVLLFAAIAITVFLPIITVPLDPVYGNQRIILIFSFFVLPELALISLYAGGLCQNAELYDSAQRWKRTAGLFLFVFIIPGIIVQFIPYIRVPFFSYWMAFIIYGGVGRLVTTVLMNIPLIFFFQSISEMATDIRVLSSSRENSGQ